MDMEEDHTQQSSQNPHCRYFVSIHIVYKKLHFINTTTPVVDTILFLGLDKSIDEHKHIPDPFYTGVLL